MSFDESTLSNVRVSYSGRDLLVSWDSSAAAGTVFQVYLARSLVWHGIARRAVLPYPGGGSTVAIDVGAVASGEDVTDFSASLPSLGYADKALLTWDGGSWEETEYPIGGFHVYAATAPSGSIDYSTIVATIPAYTPGIVTDGWDYGGWDEGGWGASSGHYTWESDSLAAGSWAFGVKAVDVLGNESTPQTATVTITGPPGPPGPNSNRQRLTYTFNVSTRVATLHWLAP